MVKYKKNSQGDCARFGLAWLWFAAIWLGLAAAWLSGGLAATWLGGGLAGCFELI